MKTIQASAKSNYTEKCKLNVFDKPLQKKDLGDIIIVKLKDAIAILSYYIFQVLCPTFKFIAIHHLRHHRRNPQASYILQ